MENILKGSGRVVGLAMVLHALVGVSMVHADPVTFRFSGSIFGVADPDDVFGTVAGDTYTAFLTYDPDLLPGTLVGDSTHYTKAAGETSISLTFSSPGDTFASDDSFPIEISIRNTVPFMVGVSGSGRDAMSIEAWFDSVTRFRLTLLESPGSNPLSSNALPTATFGGGPGTWNVSELDIDCLCGAFGDNISGSVSSPFELVTDDEPPVGVPEPSTLSLCLVGAALALSRNRQNGSRSQ